MLKSKHSGWTWELKRTPFGGGGGWNPIAAITDPISSALGTDGGGGGLLGAVADIDPGPAIGDTLASIDPGPSIGSGLAELDKGVNQIPGGWYTVGALAAGGTGLYFAPEIMAAVGAEAGTAITTEVGQAAFFDALASGATGAEAVSAGLGAEAAISGGALTTEQLLGSGGFTPAPGSEASFIVDPTVTYTTGSTAVIPDAVTATPGADAILNSPTNIGNLTPPGTGNFGSIVPPLEGSGAIPGAGAITNSSGLTGALSAGTMVGDGTLGTTIGQTYMAAGPGQFAVDAFGYAIPAGASGIAGSVPSGLSASELLSNANRARNLAKLLTGSEAKIGKMPLAKDFSQYQSALAPANMQQFGGLYEFNKNPFTFQNPLANALSGKDKAPGMYDVSGTQGQTLNTKQQNQIYSSLLRS
jgi:hypothetical protein